MVVLTPNGPIDNVAIESSNRSMEGKSTLTFETKEVQIITPFTNSIEGLIDSQIMMPNFLDKFHYKRD